MVFGQSLVAASTTLRTSLLVARMLAPTRLTTPSDMAGRPLKRAYWVRSLKVGRMVATSESVTTLPPALLMGRS